MNFKCCASIVLAGSFVLFPAPVAWATPEDDVKTITIEGQAAGTDRNAMEQAKQDALRRAVEQACGTFITGQTKVKNFQAVYDKAMSLAVGYAESFEVLSQRVEDGVSYCKIRARISTTSFEKEWARLLHTIEAEGNPRCVVVVLEDNNADDHTPPEPNRVVQSIIENFFINKGVQIMDKGASDSVRERDLGLAALNNDANKLAAIAASFKADVAVRGVAEARRAGTVEIGGRTLYRWNGTINVRAYHADSAQMLMSNTYSATKTTVNDNAGGDEVLRLCAEENAGKILRDIGEAWRKRQNVRRIIQVTIENCTYADYGRFEEALRKVDGVQNVKLKELVNNVSQVEVDWSFDIDRLVPHLAELKIEGVSFDVVEKTHDRVTLRMVK